MRGDPAAPEAIEAARELGADIQNHVTQPVTGDLVFQADYLVTMTQGHLQILLSRFPYERVAPRVLCPDGTDVADPVGCDLTVYRECARQLQQHLQPWVHELVSSES